jgi:NTP-dependent ternary conflict system VMAP-like protein/uncharacterized protein DUF4062
MDGFRQFTPAEAFISSVVDGMEAYRTAADRAVVQAGFYPKAMEHDPAASSDAVEYSLRLADRADIYIGIFAHRYGHCAADRQESISVLEYRRAVSRGIPICIFLMDEAHGFPPIHMETDIAKREKLNQFKAELRSKHVCKAFTTPEDLYQKVFEALSRVKEEHLLSLLQRRSEAASMLAFGTVKQSLWLTTKQRKQIVDLMFGGVIGIDELILDFLARKLPPQIMSAAKSARHLGHIDVYQLVNACERYPGGLHDLASAMVLLLHERGNPTPQVERNFHKAAELIREIEDHDVERMKGKALIDLASIIAALDVPATTLRELYDETVPVDPTGSGIWSLPETQEHAEPIYPILLRLSEAPFSSNGQSAIVAFGEAITQACSHDDTTALKQWLESAATLWGYAGNSDADVRPPHDLGEDFVVTRDDVGMPHDSEVPSLLLVIEPAEGSEHIEFFFSAWLQRNQRHTCLSRSPEPITLAAISVQLHSLLDVIGRDRSIPAAMRKSIRLEFFMPDYLLSHDLDAWLIDGTVKLGVIYRVIVRSLERLRGYRYQPFWEAKWLYLQNGIHGSTRDPVLWVHDARNCDGQRLHADLMDDEVICLGFTCVPPVPDFDDKHHIFSMALRAGTPIMLAPRHTPDTERDAKSARRAIHSLLSRTNLPRLPDLVLTQRREAARNGEKFHIGNALTLMWEDPTRVPPEDVDLVEPEVVEAAR